MEGLREEIWGSIEAEASSAMAMTRMKHLMLEENCHTIKVWDDDGKRCKVFKFVGWEDREDD